MTIEYSCTGSIRHLTANEKRYLKKKLDADKWFCENWGIKGDTLILDGSCEVDEYNNAKDVADEIDCLMYAFDIDAEIKTREADDEPDWGRIPYGWRGI